MAIGGLAMVPGEVPSQGVKRRMYLGGTAEPDACNPQSGSLLSVLPACPHADLGRRERWNREGSGLLLTLTGSINPRGHGELGLLSSFVVFQRS